MNPDIEAKLQSILAKHWNAAEGIKKKGEVGKTVVKARKAEITELMSHVKTWEAELVAEKAKFSHLEWSMEHGESSDYGKA